MLICTSFAVLCINVIKKSATDLQDECLQLYDSYMSLLSINCQFEGPLSFSSTCSPTTLYVYHPGNQFYDLNNEIFLGS